MLPGSGDSLSMVPPDPGTKAARRPAACRVLAARADIPMTLGSDTRVATGQVGAFSAATVDRQGAVVALVVAGCCFLGTVDAFVREGAGIGVSALVALGPPQATALSPRIAVTKTATTPAFHFTPLEYVRS